MRLVIGLGNPGVKYKFNRHNAGYMVIEKLQDSKTSKLKALVTDTFMNESGAKVKYFCDYYKIKPSDLYVVFDDLDIRIGEYKIQDGRGPKDHNGLNSIYESLGTKEFWHVRVGVDNREADNRIPGEDYVLQNFTESERETISKTIERLLIELNK